MQEYFWGFEGVQRLLRFCARFVFLCIDLDRVPCGALSQLRTARDRAVDSLLDGGLRSHFSFMSVSLDLLANTLSVHFTPMSAAATCVTALIVLCRSAAAS